MRIAALIFVLVSLLAAEDLVIVIGGELGNNREVRNVARSFCELEGVTGKPVFYKSRRGVERCRKNLRKELKEIDYTPYEQVHFFCFILGGMALSPIFEEIRPKNTGRVVVVKGPLEETLPTVAPSVYPSWAIQFAFGSTIEDIAALNYTSFADDFPVGMIIETEPNPLALHVQKKMIRKFGDLERESISMRSNDLFSVYSDYFYINLHHNDLYKYPLRYRDEAMYFFRNGHFSDTVQRSAVEEVRFFPKISKKI